MFKRGKKRLLIEQNADVPTAGLSTKDINGEKAMRHCLTMAHPEELAESLVRAQKCGECNAKWSYLPEGAFMDSSSLQDLLSEEERKSRFASFKERFYEDLFFKRPKVGEIKPAFSKPDSVTNMSRTFGRPSRLTPCESLYSMIMPLKSPEQVNSEYAKSHEKRIFSHNHYFPAEQINRKYSPPFDRHNPCGNTKSDAGDKVKRCLTEGENHLKVIGKAQVDFMERTVAPLGKKFETYLYKVPDITFGARPRSIDAKMIIYNIDSSTRTDLMMNAISHLNTVRLGLRKRDDIHFPYLITVMQRSDPEETGLLPLARLQEILQKYRIRLEAQKIRIVMSHYQMIVDEGLCSERVKYREFCKLLSCKEQLPSMGGVATYANLGSLDTTYQLFCADRQKQHNNGDVHQLQKEKTAMKELLSPELDALSGLQASDFSQLRPKLEIEQVFRNLIAKDEFESIWQSLITKYQDQDGLVSVTQFHQEMQLEK